MSTILKNELVRIEIEERSMNPVKQIAGVVAKPLGVAAKVLNSPTASNRYSPLYGLNVLDALRGKTLEGAVRDRIVMITGASSGIGAVTAVKIGAAGGTVVLVARGAEKLEATGEQVREGGGSAYVYPCDLSDLEAIDAMADRVIADLGAVDILINNAGRSIRRSLQLCYDRMHY